MTLYDIFDEGQFQAMVFNKDEGVNLVASYRFQVAGKDVEAWLLEQRSDAGLSLFKSYPLPVTGNWEPETGNP